MTKSVLYSLSPLLASKTPVWRSKFVVAAIALAFAGLAGLVSAGVNATANALYTGDSETRLTVLTQLKQSFDAQAPQPIDPQLAAWILPAIEQCRTDSDPEVVALAGELADHITDKTSPPTQ